MKRYTKMGTVGVVGLGLGVAVLAATTLPASAAEHVAAQVISANPAFGIQNNVLSADMTQTPVAYGQLPLANPKGGLSHYGYGTANGGPLTQDPHEALKTEPDKNVYLVFGNKHYLYQGHEGGTQGYVTRVDLDEKDLTKRVTLIADARSDGGSVPTFDGITWNPFTHQLLMTAEASAPNGGVFAVTLDDTGDPVDGAITKLDALGSGGYEGIQNDSAGNVWLVEDIGGKSVSGGKAPGSYVYRFTPASPTDLSSGKLEALQVQRKDGSPVTAKQLAADPADPFIADLHTYGSSFSTRWVALTLGADNGSTAAAAAAGATPFKRPENGVFRPGTNFTEFYFTETGDTSKNSTLPGAFGGVFRLSQSSPTAQTGTLSPVYVGDLAHTGLDNIQFKSRDELLVVEDAGDALHAQRNALDSGYVIDVSKKAGKHATAVRWLAEGRDASAAYDHNMSPGYNDGDNEITGVHVSNGDPSVRGLLGATIPSLFTNGWRGFWTQQHGDNVTWELLPAAPTNDAAHHGAKGGPDSHRQETD
ncbi:alkaline phosphatase PhoX [Cryobacterium tepidiphilum]|uniref:DUF839 domain-containing protein n=1 Tax=Cryobacterium tepidiphilum TaxID=2486026 RepID=A0A3M8LMY9_9MICO|nr:alkaline phosphatase PhoX [Cryobacterium tepidiphilum]RNE66751.1 DUF839 domain-containing protein [Cryobacterium tepidiphilum]